MSKDANYNRMINSKEWLTLRNKKLGRNPLCQDCMSDGYYVPATEVHHITPVESAANLREMESLMFSYDNLRSLCHNCHAATHMQMKSHSKEAIKENTRKSIERFKKKFFE